MNKIFGHPFVILTARLILGYIFVTYGMGKILAPEKFASEIANYALFPEFALNLIALILPWLEFIAGLLLVLGLRLKSSSAISGILMASFILSVLWAMALGLDINCGCSSTAPQKVGLPKLLENLGLLLLSALIFIFPERRFTLESISDK